MSRDQIVNPNSVQSQFASLVRDKENLLKQSTNADNERRQEESRLQHFRSLQTSLSEKIRIANATLGVQSTKKQMLKTEIQRLNKVLQEDRNTIEKVAIDVGRVESENLQKKFQFVSEMDRLNDELTDALRMYEEKGIERALASIESCKSIQHFLREKMLLSELPTLEHSQEWNGISLAMDNAIKALENSHKRLQSEKYKYSSFCDQAKAMRRHVEMKHSKVIIITLLFVKISFFVTSIPTQLPVFLLTVIGIDGNRILMGTKRLQRIQ